jgi:hypothetical protein
MALPDSEDGREQRCSVFLYRSTLERVARILGLPIAFWRA